MTTTSWAQSERQQLSDLFEEVGPDAPTLCGDWTTSDLAAHLVLRESRPDAALGIVIKPLAGWTDRTQNSIASRPWPELIESVRNGPPRFSPFSLPKADALANTGEFFVHLEDVRRAGDDWQPRDLPPKFAGSLWGICKARGKGLLRRVPIGVVLHRTDGDGGEVNARSGSPRVVISGPAAELLLYCYGRKEQSQVHIEGSPEAVAALRDADLSI